MKRVETPPGLLSKQKGNFFDITDSGYEKFNIVLDSDLNPHF